MHIYMRSRVYLKGNFKTGLLEVLCKSCEFFEQSGQRHFKLLSAISFANVDGGARLFLLPDHKDVVVLCHLRVSDLLVELIIGEVAVDEVASLMHSPDDLLSVVMHGGVDRDDDTLAG